jgi:hypothetical protein
MFAVSLTLKLGSIKADSMIFQDYKLRLCFPKIAITRHGLDGHTFRKFLLPLKGVG